MCLQMEIKYVAGVSSVNNSTDHTPELLSLRAENFGLSDQYRHFQNIPNTHIIYQQQIYLQPIKKQIGKQ